MLLSALLCCLDSVEKNSKWYVLLFKMGLVAKIYHTFFKKTSTFIGVIVVGAFVAEVGTEAMANYIWENNNKGVSLGNHSC